MSAALTRAAYNLLHLQHHAREVGKTSEDIADMLQFFFGALRGCYVERYISIQDIPITADFVTSMKDIKSSWKCQGQFPLGCNRAGFARTVLLMHVGQALCRCNSAETRQDEVNCAGSEGPGPSPRHLQTQVPEARRGPAYFFGPRSP